MPTLRHLVAALTLLALLAVAVVAFFLYDPFSASPRFLSRSSLITATDTGVEPLTADEPPVQVTDPPAMAALALHYQPTVVVSAEDRFWPVSLLHSLRLRFRGHTTCLHSRGRCRIHAPVPGDLARRSSPSDFLQYPTPLDRVRDAFLSAARALGVPEEAIAGWQRRPADINPFASAQVYFYYRPRAPTGTYRGVPHGLVSLQYWFYYPLNYFPLPRSPLEALTHPLTSRLDNTDYHQGDFEHVAVLLDPNTLRPRYLWMARHADEGQVYRWRSPSVQWDGDHSVIYAALGSHASYAHCGIQRRSRTYWFISDHVVCAPHRNYGFTYNATRLVDLAHTSWACWRGRFGQAGPALTRRVYGLLPFETDGPFSPLLQQENFGSACRLAPRARPAPPAL